MTTCQAQIMDAAVYGPGGFVPPCDGIGEVEVHGYLLCAGCSDALEALEALFSLSMAYPRYVDLACGDGPDGDLIASLLDERLFRRWLAKVDTDPDGFVEAVRADLRAGRDWRDGGIGTTLVLAANAVRRGRPRDACDDLRWLIQGEVGMRAGADDARLELLARTNLERAGVPAACVEELMA